MNFSSRRQPRYGLVLLAIVVVIAVLAATTSKFGQFLAFALLGVTLLLALQTTQARARTQQLAAVLVVLAFATALVFEETAFRVSPYVDLTTLVIVGITPAVLARRLLKNPEVTGQSLLGASSVYLLMGLFFSFAYAVTAEFGNAPFFTSVSNPGTADYLYFSFITLATVGYGDLVARTTLGHMMAAAEGLTGQIYLVTVVALLVSHFRPRPADSQPNPRPAQRALRALRRGQRSRLVHRRRPAL
jgi:hypothetical protein